MRKIAAPILFPVLFLTVMFQCRDNDFSREELLRLQAHFTQEPAENIALYLEQLPRLTRSSQLKSALAAHAARRSLTDEQLAILGRALGIYVRSRYQREMLESLGQLIAIPSFRHKKIEPHKNAAILSIGRTLEKMARSFGLKYYNRENRIFEILLPGDSSKSLGIYTHADVVPVIAEQWKLPDGRILNPFQMELIDGKLYGRGTEDDKSSIVAALFAMRAVEEAGLPLRRSVRLLVETTEETGSQGIRYYKSKYNLPEYNVVLDSFYPVVVAEKGFGVIRINFPRRSVAGNHVVEAVSGGTAVNQIAALSAIVIKSADPRQLQAKIEPLAKRFTEQNGGNFSITMRRMPGRLHLELKGKSAHSAQPEKGVNPLPRALLLLHFLKQQGVDLKRNHYLNAAHFVAENFGLDYKGKKLAIAYEDPFMGPLTLSLTQIQLISAGLQLNINARIPRGQSPQELTQSIREKLSTFRKANKVDFEMQFDLAPHLYRNPQGRWIGTLLNIFSQVTGEAAKPISSAGTTTARELPNGINFGPAMPSEQYRGHTANEYKKLANFLLDAQMFTEMIVRLPNLESME